MSADTYEIPQSNIPIPDRLTYIPSWYKPHKNLDRQVIDADDGDLGFTIGHVLPERRWAIQEDGRLLPQHQFEIRFKQWCERVLTPAGTIIEIKRINKYFDVNLETIPGVDEFVDAKPDPSMPTTNPNFIRYVPIAFTLGPETGRRKIRPIYNFMGEVAEKNEAPAPVPEGFAPVVKKTVSADPLLPMPCGKMQKEKFQANHKRFCKRCKQIELEASQAQTDTEIASVSA